MRENVRTEINPGQIFVAFKYKFFVIEVIICKNLKKIGE